MYDFTRRQFRDEVAISREARLGFAEVLAMVAGVGLVLAVIVWLA